MNRLIFALFLCISYTSHGATFVSSRVLPSGAVRYTEMSNFNGVFDKRVKVRFWTIYTWNSATTNILITNTTFGTALVAGDHVIVPFRTGGYRSYYLQNLNNGGANNDYIYIDWAATAFITPSSSTLQANGIENCVGVYTTGMKMNDHVDAAMRLIGTSYSSYIVWDSCYFQGMPGFGPVQASSVAAFNGDSLRTWHHWIFRRCVWDSLYGSTDGGVALAIGGTAGGSVSATVGWWRDVTIDRCWFGHYSSNTVASNYIRMLTSANVTISNSHFEWLGIVASPTGHAGQVTAIAAKYNYINNTAGPFNFGNEIRDLGPVDFPMWGSAYQGRSVISGVLITDKRKYPAFEFQDINSGVLSTISAYVQPRAAAYVSNITAYNLSTDNGSYLTAIVDMYKTDSLFIKNSTVIGVRNGTWGNNSGFGPFIFHINTTISNQDTASCRLTQLWTDAGLQDSIKYIPAKNGTLYNAGVSATFMASRDLYNTPRPLIGRSSGSGIDIGATQLVLGIVIYNGQKIKAQ